MLPKESKIRILENFKALDYLFFGKPAKKMTNCCPALIEDYITVKGALSSLMIEMYTLIGHTPEIATEAIDTISLVKSAKESAKIARENAQKLVNTDQGKADIKAELREALEENSDVDLEEEVKEKIRQKAFSLAIDNLLLARAVNESANIKALDEWEGKIVEDAYKVLRDHLVDSALFVIEAHELTK